MAIATAAARLAAPSFRIALPMCHLTVTSDIERASAISPEVFPLATRRRIWPSRRVRAIDRPYPKVQGDRTSHSVSNPEQAYRRRFHPSRDAPLSPTGGRATAEGWLRSCGVVGLGLRSWTKRQEAA